MSSLLFRPPLQAAIQSFFQAKQRPVVFASGRQWKHKGHDLITYQVEYTRAPNMVACQGASIQGGMYHHDGNNKRWLAASSKAERAEYFGHGTSVEAGLPIALDGFIKAGPGICGKGIYAFAAAGTR